MSLYNWFISHSILHSLSLFFPPLRSQCIDTFFHRTYNILVCSFPPLGWEHPEFRDCLIYPCFLGARHGAQDVTRAQKLFAK